MCLHPCFFFGLSNRHANETSPSERLVAKIDIIFVEVVAVAVLIIAKDVIFHSLSSLYEP
jgi:hypothetical protein